jgi:hypothetical protein
MAVPDFQPCYFSSDEAGAPVLNNAASALIDLLSACLVSGFNVKAITQIVVTDEVAVATSADHGFQAVYGKLLLIDGVSEPGLNGRVQPTEVTTNTFTFAAPGVDNGTYSTGSMSAKRAPLGWTKPHADVPNHKAIFARSEPSATTSMLYVLNGGASHIATVEMCASASNVDSRTESGAGTAPYWSVGANSSGAKQWALVGDGFRFWFLPEANVGLPGLLYFFGDPTRLYPGDTGHCFLTTATTSGLGVGQSLWGLTVGAAQAFTGTTYSAAFTFQRRRNLTPGLLTAGILGPAGWGDAGASGDAAIPITSDYYLKDSTGEVRARVPGLFVPQGARPFAAGSVFSFDGLDRHLLCLRVRVGNNTGDGGQVLLDLTGPWDLQA